MLPFWSFFRNKGRCPYCDEPLPRRHIIVDSLELVWVSFYILKFGWSYEGTVAMLYGMALIGIIFLTKEKRELSNSLLMIMGMLAVIHLLAYHQDEFPEAALGMLFGVAVLGFYNLIKVLLTNDSTFEIAELKLGALIGLFLGIQLGLVTLFFALVGGAVIGSLNVKFFKKSADEAMPTFTELMASAALIALLWGQEVLNLYQNTILG